ncbi:MAG: hypothetical protein C4547_04570 [Phycisphaerales bacterium]|nr:MAG: hypothetical protein C4547_04570 [Phycisphaerales bacterium]
MAGLTIVATWAPFVALASPPDASQIVRDEALSPESRTRICVLGTIHLGQLAEEAPQRGIKALLDVLEKYKPDLIAVERIPGETIEFWLRQTPTYDQQIAAFAASAIDVGLAAQKHLNVTRREAEAQAAELLKTSQADPTGPVDAGQCARAAMLLAAAFDVSSAALQWSYLTNGQRAQFPAEAKAVATGLDKVLRSPTEDVAIGVALARRLGHNRLASIDDQCDAAFQLEHGAAMMAELGQTDELRKLQDSVLMTELPARTSRAMQSGDLVGLYRWINSAEYARADVDAQWHIFLRSRLASGLDRARAAAWEARNLIIAANLRRAIVAHRASRVLVIMGASHRPFLEAYLGQMMDVEIVAPETLLGS